MPPSFLLSARDVGIEKPNELRGPLLARLGPLLQLRKGSRYRSEVDIADEL